MSQCLGAAMLQVHSSRLGHCMMARGVQFSPGNGTALGNAGPSLPDALVGMLVTCPALMVWGVVTSPAWMLLGMQPCSPSLLVCSACGICKTCGFMSCSVLPACAVPTCGPAAHAPLPPPPLSAWFLADESYPPQELEKCREKRKRKYPGEGFSKLILPWVRCLSDALAASRCQKEGFKT